METTFMTIHNLSPEANIQWASESITEVLGYQPEDVIGRSCFDYFHPEEIPFARQVHNKGVQLDKAAVLHYARIKSAENQWVGCECVFTIVHDVLIACTSIYRGSAKNERRAAIAPTIRRIFSSSPKDPRYHMLEELSVKFRTPVQATPREPRAALILNRFSRELFVLYATNAVSEVLGVTPDEIRGKAFYKCIQENCLPDAIRCLESAKANDSIAYLRFWYHDPRSDEYEDDQEMQDYSHSSDSEDGGVRLNMDLDRDSSGGASVQPYDYVEHSPSVASHPPTHRTSSGDSSVVGHSGERVFDELPEARSSTSSLALSAHEPRRSHTRSAVPQRERPESFEIEAVISCTSDGLVVVLRRARPMSIEHQNLHPNGIYAAPWGANPIRPHQFEPEDPRLAFQHGFSPAPERPRASVEVGGPPTDQFMHAIREVAVFAWSLAGINGNIAAYGRGTPYGESQPPTGLPVWDPRAQPNAYVPPENQAMQRWIHVDQRTSHLRHEDRLPFQYRWHQEQDLKYQPGYGIGPLQTLRQQPMRLQETFTPNYRKPGYDVYYNIYHNQTAYHQQQRPMHSSISSSLSNGYGQETGQFYQQPYNNGWQPGYPNNGDAHGHMQPSHPSGQEYGQYQGSGFTEQQNHYQ